MHVGHIVLIQQVLIGHHSFKHNTDLQHWEGGPLFLPELKFLGEYNYYKAHNYTQQVYVSIKYRNEGSLCQLYIVV